MTDDLAFNGYDDKQPGLGAAYPKMLFRAGGAETLHGYAVSTTIVNSEDEEFALMADGWALTPTLAHKPAAPPLPDPRDDRIAELEAMIAAGQPVAKVDTADVEPPKRGPGRPKLSASF